MPTVLVVEDEQMLAKIIGIKLQSEGYAVLHAYDGQEAYEILAGSEKPDIVLLDVLLPKMSGFEVLEKLHADHAEIPKVVVFSNFAQKADVDKAYELGAVDYIVKAAFSPAEIIAKVEQYTKVGEEAAAQGSEQPKLTVVEGGAEAPRKAA